MTRAWGNLTWPQKWVAGVMSAVVSSLILLAIVDRNALMREQIIVDMRLQSLERIPFPATFPPTETRESLAVIELKLARMQVQLDELDEKLGRLEIKLFNHDFYRIPSNQNAGQLHGDTPSD